MYLIIIKCSFCASIIFSYYVICFNQKFSPDIHEDSAVLRYYFNFLNEKMKSNINEILC